jgi:hypothetical protein
MESFPIFTEMALLLLLAAIIGTLGIRLRQPLIVAYIAAGILVGPSVLGLVHANDQIDLLAKLGITLLLLVVGLKLDLHIIRTMGPVELATGLGQVIFTSVVGYFDHTPKIREINTVSRDCLFKPLALLCGSHISQMGIHRLIFSAASIVSPSYLAETQY